MVLPPSFSRKMGEIETVGAEKMGWLDLPRGTSYPTFPYSTYVKPLRVFRPSLGLFESSWRFWEPKFQNAQFWPLTWPWPDTWPFKKQFKSVLETSRRDLSNAASPVSLRTLVWELAWGALCASPPPRSMAFGWDPGQVRVNRGMQWW